MWCDSIRKMNNATNILNNPPEITVDDSAFIDNCTFKSPSQCFWEYEVLHMSDGIHLGAGEFHWQLILCLILAWIVIFFALIKGIKSSGKPWYKAAVQIFYSLGVGWGGLVVMASYNKFHNNVHRDAILVAFINCGTSVFAGFVIFSVIGHMSLRSGVPIESAVASGPGLAFIAYPEGIALMPVPQLWAVLFFLMLFSLGLDTQFTMMETVITSVVDEFPWLRKGKRKIVFTLGLCILLFILGLPQCASNGVYVMELFNWYSAGFSLFIVSIFEIIAVSYVYGFWNLKEDIKLMIGNDVLFRIMYWPYWFTNWVFITPCLLVFIFGMACANHEPITYAGKPNAYPTYADGMGWFMVVFAVIWIPIMAIVEYVKKLRNMATIGAVFRPEPGWGPAVDRFRTGRYAGTSANPENDPPSYKGNSGFDPDEVKF